MPVSELMKLSYFHVGSDVPQGVVPETAVVIDVLRATTTIAWALHNGAEAIETFADLRHLRERASLFPSSSRLLIGERGGKKLDGFDLGNSPIGVTPDVVNDKRLFMSTTNGTKSLHSVRKAKHLYTMALPNRRAVAERLIEDQPENVWIVGSGWEGAYSLEDSLAAGGLAELIGSHSSVFVNLGNDEMTAALSLWKNWEKDIEGCLRTATHGKRLINLGDHDEDFRCCAGLDQLSIVPTQKQEGVLCAR